MKKTNGKARNPDEGRLPAARCVSSPRAGSTKTRTKPCNGALLPTNVSGGVWGHLKGQLSSALELVQKGRRQVSTRSEADAQGLGLREQRLEKHRK